MVRAGSIQSVVKTRVLKYGTRSAPPILFLNTLELLVLRQPPVDVLFVIRQPGMANMDDYVRQRGPIRANQLLEFMLEKRRDGNAEVLGSRMVRRCRLAHSSLKGIGYAGGSI